MFPRSQDARSRHFARRRSSTPGPSRQRRGRAPGGAALLSIGVTTAALVAPATAQAAVPESATAIVASAALAASADGAYTPVASPFRALDTRLAAKLGPGGRASVKITGRGGIPTTGVTAAVVNLTVHQPTAPSGWLTAWASGRARPTTSNLNFLKNWTRANLATVPVGADGNILVENALGQSHVFVDVMGYYRSGSAALTGTYGSYLPIHPARVLDTRSDGSGAVPGGTYIEQVLTSPEEPTLMEHVTAVAFTVTAVNPTAAGYLTAFNGDPKANLTVSSLNYPARMNVANMSIVPVSKCLDCGEPGILFGIDNVSAGATDVQIDVIGLYADNTITDGLRFTPLASPQRIMDTRLSRGARTFSAGQTQTLATPPSYPDDAVSLVGNLTLIQPTAGTYVTMWPANSPATSRPTISNVNANAQHPIASHAMPLLGDNGSSIFNAAGSVNMLFDVAGTMRPDTDSTASTASLNGLSTASAGTAESAKSVDLKVARTTYRTR